jgi:DNA repair protein RadA/Sms
MIADCELEVPDPSTNANGNGRNWGTQNPAPLAPLAPLDSHEPAAGRKLISLDEVQREEIEFLVPNFVPLGNITVLNGPKAEGKSTLIIDLAARVTSGRPMPLCSEAGVSGGVILLQAEDDLDSTVKGNVEAAEGILDRFRVFSKANPLYLDRADDLRLVQQAAAEIDAKLLVVDPFSEFFSKALKDEKVIRESLRGVRALAAERKMAVIFVGHFTKSGNNPLYRGLGGVAVINAARASLVVGHDPASDDPFRHVLAFNRGNLPRTRNVSLRYRTVKRGDAIVVEWLGESRCSADDLLAGQNSDAHSQLQEACYVLYAILRAEGGSLPAKAVSAAADDALVSVGTLKRAKRALKVRSRRRSFPILLPPDENNQSQQVTMVQWIWELPDDDELLQPYRERFLREKTENEVEQRDQAPDQPPTTSAANSDSSHGEAAADGEPQ